ncbi:mechanosensitive ion channel family protein [Spirilliplanes yamanashiensis]|uniref:Mechanosensitive ion channel protein MscS n=1 Tax=Spirilliplanes yamanashiensis TaxID=42233 RepID=A0A8J3YCC0_9ACTN|nr:mechanosensitive ion channel domain-containing protein [Spirilliplanes yamanashiensis]MDP9818707.1 small-conductance mechanosensitive channel [Spirilliplanes yamanashiensis]GIJ05162.1 mechanosensitive ion channel protein MscS [Spirilliplanes yamanashiensis]
MPDPLRAVLAVLGAALLAVVVVQIVHRAVVRLGRRSPLLTDLARTAHRPFQAAVLVYAVQQGVRSAAGDFPLRGGVLHALVLAVIAALAWLVAALVLVVEDASLAKWRTDVPDNLKARRLRTQVVVLRRVTVAAIVVLTLGVMLMTFPAVRAVGGGVLASAGVVSVVVALAAQSTLGNLIAGLQLAFSDSLRLDDVVVVEGEWGRIEELTLSYVVVQIWDDRRLVLPTSYFTTKPFQHWTRTGSAVLGTAEFDVDWSVPVEDARAELRAVCEGSELWDGRVCVLQVTEAVGGTVRLRALVSARDAGSLWDLRCLVRERLVGWLREHHPDALPRWRTELSGAAAGASPGLPPPPAQTRAGDDARVFGGSPDGIARSGTFAGKEDAAPR